MNRASADRRLAARRGGLAGVAVVLAVIATGCSSVSHAGHDRPHATGTNSTTLPFPSTGMSTISTTPPFPTTTTATTPTATRRALASPAFATNLTELAATQRQVLESYIGRSGRSDTRYWEDGSFLATDGTPCWYCYDSGAVAAAVQSELGAGDPRLRQIAIDTYTTAIRRYELPDGEIEANGAPDSVGTTFFMADLGITYLELRAHLDAATRTLWADAMERSANWLESAGQTTFYINGNVNLRQTEDLWLTWAVTGKSAYWRDYVREWSFTLHPPRPRWAGYGLIITKQPTGSDGEHGAGYLTEAVQGGKPGFDPSYTQAQLDDATALYDLTRDPRYLSLMNLLFNQDRPLVDSSDILDAFRGSRKDDLVAFTTAAPAVFVLSGARPGLAGFWRDQLITIRQQYLGAMGFSNVNFYKGLASDLSIPILAVQWPDGLLGRPCTAAGASPVCRALF